MKKWFTLLFASMIILVNAQDFITKIESNEEVGSIAVSDFTGDGYPDIIGYDFRGANSIVYLYTNNKSSSIGFTRSVVKSQIEVLGQPLAVDLDGDGDMDLVHSKTSSQNIEVFINNGSGVFTAKALGISGSVIFKAADMDKDGDMDLVGYNFNPKTVKVYINNGDMTFTSKTVFQGSNSLSSFDIGDFDKNGLIDIVVSTSAGSGNQVIIFENKGNNTYTEKVIFKDKFSSVGKIEVADVNKDGKSDLVIVDYDNIILGLNAGAFVFSDKKLITASEGYFLSTHTTDVTGEGQMDMVIGTSRKTIWLKNINKSDFSFEERSFSPVNSIFTSLQADFNKDGAVDFASANFTLSYYTNNITQTPSNTKDQDVTYKIYPNPVADVVTIEGLSGDDYSAIYYNSVGMEILKNKVIKNTSDVRVLQAGTYTMQIQDSKGQIIGSKTIVKF